MNFKQCERSKDNVLELGIDKLEDRLMLAVDVSVRGENVTIVGDNFANLVDIYVESDTIWVNDQDTGLATIKNLKINMKDSNSEVILEREYTGFLDVVDISNQVEVTGNTVIKLGNGFNELYFGGLHNKVKIVGGKGGDYVRMQGGIGTSKNVISLKGGDDFVDFDVDAYVDAATTDTPLAAYLENIPLEESSLGLIPSIKVNLGGGDDEFNVVLDGVDATDDDVLEGINSLTDDLDLGVFASVEEAGAALTEYLDEVGIKLPQSVKLNGGGGTDTLAPGSVAVIIDLIGSQKGFEAFGTPDHAN